MTQAKSVLVIGLMVAGMATAQEAARERPEHMIEEVFVTVSKRTESVQDISAAVSAFPEDLLKDNNIQGFSALADITPGLVSRDGNNLTIRGIGQARNGTSPVAFHVNGYFINEHDAAEEFYDISTVEVIRGPSGTVYGRNATAGAINVRWNRPEETWTGGVEYRRANYNAER